MARTRLHASTRRARASGRPLRTVVPVALAIGTPLLPAAPAWAQEPPAPALQRVVVSVPSLPQAQVAGFEPQPLERLPLQATVVPQEQLQDRGVSRLADLVRLDASIGDAYNAPGYWDIISVRGFVLDNRYNFRRDGLPINAETSIPLDNKERLEVLKGTSGMQAGVSSPGGLANYVVKRPLDVPVRSARLQWEQSGSVLGALDLGTRFGDGEAFGVRLNAAAERLDPRVRDARGDRQLLALAGDWKGADGWLVEAELETSRRSQPSVPGFSLLGDALPSPVDPRLNLNNQPWSQPVVFGGDTGSVRVSAPLAAGWRWKVHAARQSLTTDDRLAFPYGCSAEGRFDRYCSDGTYDLYDYRSDDERRRTDALEASVSGSVETGAVRHDLTFGALASRTRLRFDRQAFNFVGIGNVQGTAVTPADPTLTTENTNRDEASDELFVRYSAGLTEALRLWGGLRFTRLHRESVRTDGTEPTDTTQDFTVPFVAASVDLAPGLLGYASYGQGVESEVAPNQPRYANAGQPLPALRSRQWEFGLKGLFEPAMDAGQAVVPGQGDWTLALFDIVRPAFADFGTCDVDASCTRQVDGEARHLGLEAAGQWRWSAWTFSGSAMALRARRQGSQVAGLNGLPPTNVPSWSLRAAAQQQIASVPGLRWWAAVAASGSRSALPDNSVRIPSVSQWDLGASWVQRHADTTLTWRAGLDNVFDRRDWRESPYQFSHAYLYPLPPRTARVSLQIDY